MLGWNLLPSILGGFWYERCFAGFSVALKFFCESLICKIREAALRKELTRGLAFCEI